MKGNILVKVVTSNAQIYDIMIHELIWLGYNLYACHCKAVLHYQ
jgi:hypothetical protein